MQKSPTALTLNLDTGYVLGSTPPGKWVRVQERNLLGCFQALGASSRDASWVTTDFWGSSLPSLSSPLLCLNSLLGQPCWDPSDNLSQDGQDYHIQNNFGFSSDTAQLHLQNGWYTQPTDLIFWLHLRFLSPIPLKTWPLLPSLPLCPSLLQLHYFLA